MEEDDACWIITVYFVILTFAVITKTSFSKTVMDYRIFIYLLYSLLCTIYTAHSVLELFTCN